MGRFIVLNGPLGIGKSTLAELLTESIDRCVLLDGDHIAFTNPPPPDAASYLQATIDLLVERHLAAGYRNFVVSHYWATAVEIDDLRRRLESHDFEFRCFLLTLPEAENLRRIERRQGARAIDEIEFELRTVLEERQVLGAAVGAGLGEPFDVSASPPELVARMLEQMDRVPRTIGARSSIRRAAKADATEIMDVRLSVTENALAPNRMKELGIHAESIAEMLGESHCAHCAVLEGRVVGFSMGDLAAGSVFALFIRPEHEGRGLGKKLLEATVRDLWRQGHGRLRLTTEPGTRAYEFYTRQGWRHMSFTEEGEAELVLTKVEE